MKILVFLLFILAIKANQNYQQRTIYYGEHDNVCKSGRTSDSINVTVIIDEKFTSNDIRTSTVDCNGWMPFYYMQLQPSRGYSAFITKDEEEIGYINFNDETVWTYRLRELVQVRSKSTVDSVRIYNEEKYTCTIIGDKISHHFGNVPVLVKSINVRMIKCI